MDHVHELILPGLPGERMAQMAMRPLHSSLAVTAVEQATETVIDAIADGVIRLDERLAIRKALALACDMTQHADDCERFAQAIKRDTGDVVYLAKLAAKAGYPDPLEAA